MTAATFKMREAHKARLNAAVDAYADFLSREPDGRLVFDASALPCTKDELAQELLGRIHRANTRCKAETYSAALLRLSDFRVDACDTIGIGDILRVDLSDKAAVQASAAGIASLRCHLGNAANERRDLKQRALVALVLNRRVTPWPKRVLLQLWWRFKAATIDRGGRVDKLLRNGVVAGRMQSRAGER